MKQIPLTQGKYAQVDDGDFDFLNQWKWHAYKDGERYYARRYDCSNGGKVLIVMHRLLMKPLNGQLIDHIDGDGLNNTKNNLRFCTYKENAINRQGWGSSKYLGVSFDKSSGKWRSRINIGNGNISIGKFKTETEAAQAYNTYAEKYHGEFARLNTI